MLEGLGPAGSLMAACAVTLLVSILTIGAYVVCVVRPRANKLAKRKPSPPKLDTGVYSLKTREKVGELVEDVEDKPPPSPKGELRVLYGTLKGASKEAAIRAAAELRKDGWAASASSLADVEAAAVLPRRGQVLLVLPTYTQGTPTADAEAFVAWLQKRSDQGSDAQFAPLTELRYSVLGLGHSDYDAYNAVAKRVEEQLRRLCAKPMGKGLMLADEAKGGYEAVFDSWITQVRDVLGATVPSDDETDGGVGDMEDMMHDPPADPEREMINPRMRRALEKQGYKLLGTHSGVKLCRWTQNQLRGRGGCYKHTFYGIVSYRCMEMTPSLACANKCVFCWRHHTNPVATSWKWKSDSPQFLVDQAIEGQRSMIKPLKGVPGVDPERYKDALNPRHCALSLVGEPIIYPEINELVAYMHAKGISTFMVTNAQFPEKIETLRPVTQLYVSIDAATRDSLEAVDRPLFSDFWERFLASIDAMRSKGQRTVFRLTLVKQWNVTEVADYAHLIQRGQPDFIEVKGVTWCGESTASSLTMSNVPFHQEVVKFVTELAAACGSDYGLACEHEHSCCMLIAHTKFRREGKWNTWIDFDRFIDLDGTGRKDFTSQDYALPTPDWAVYGNEARGFDPDEKRFKKQRNHPGKE